MDLRVWGAKALRLIEKRQRCLVVTLIGQTPGLIERGIKIKPAFWERIRTLGPPMGSGGW